MAIKIGTIGEVPPLLEPCVDPVDAPSSELLVGLPCPLPPLPPLEDGPVPEDVFLEPPVEAPVELPPLFPGTALEACAEAPG
jgi:hypothetical protein